MKKKVAAIILEAIPLAAAPVFYPLIAAPCDSGLVRAVIAVTMLLAFLGVGFFFLGRLLAKESKAVLILGILDCAATLYVVAFYVFVILTIAM
ncbi:MAG: hypothetical protein J5849_05625 [Clostridia bacterium]|nr:hypothetical protein [Clostridia bacterium]